MDVGNRFFTNSDSIANYLQHTTDPGDLKSSQDLQNYASDLSFLTGRMPGSPYDPSFQHEFRTLQFAHTMTKTRYLGEVLMGMVVIDRLNFILTKSDGLPIIHDPSRTYTWNTLTYKRGLIDIEPEEGVARVMRHKRSKDSTTVERRGIAFYIEHGFLYTPEGRIHYQRSMRQIKESILLTWQLSAVAAVIDARVKQADYELREKGYYRTKDWIKIIEDNNARCFIAQKSEQGPETITILAKNVLDMRGFSASTAWITPECQLYFRGTGEEKTSYKEGGERALTVAKSDPSTLTNFMGLRLCPIPDFQNDLPQGLPLNPLKGGYAFGQFAKATGPHIKNVNLATYTSNHRSTAIMDYDQDTYKTFGLGLLLDNCYVFDNPDDPGGDYPPGFHLGSRRPDSGSGIMLRKAVPVRDPADDTTDSVTDLFGCKDPNFFNPNSSERGNIRFCEILGEVDRKYLSADLIKAMARKLLMVFNNRSNEVQKFLSSFQETSPGEKKFDQKSDKVTRLVSKLFEPLNNVTIHPISASVAIDSRFDYDRNKTDELKGSILSGELRTRKGRFFNEPGELRKNFTHNLNDPYGTEKTISSTMSNLNDPNNLYTFYDKNPDEVVKGQSNRFSNIIGMRLLSLSTKKQTFDEPDYIYATGKKLLQQTNVTMNLKEHKQIKQDSEKVLDLSKPIYVTGNINQQDVIKLHTENNDILKVHPYADDYKSLISDSKLLESKVCLVKTVNGLLKQDDKSECGDILKALVEAKKMDGDNYRKTLLDFHERYSDKELDPKPTYVYTNKIVATGASLFSPVYTQSHKEVETVHSIQVPSVNNAQDTYLGEVGLFHIDDIENKIAKGDYLLMLDKDFQITNDPSEAILNKKDPAHILEAKKLKENKFFKVVHDNSKKVATGGFNKPAGVEKFGKKSIFYNDKFENGDKNFLSSLAKSYPDVVAWAYFSSTGKSNKGANSLNDFILHGPKFPRDNVISDQDYTHLTKIFDKLKSNSDAMEMDYEFKSSPTYNFEQIGTLKHNYIVSNSVVDDPESEEIVLNFAAAGDETYDDFARNFKQLQLLFQNREIHFREYTFLSAIQTLQYYLEEIFNILPNIRDDDAFNDIQTIVFKLCRDDSIGLKLHHHLFEGITNVPDFLGVFNSERLKNVILQMKEYLRREYYLNNFFLELSSNIKTFDAFGNAFNFMKTNRASNFSNWVILNNLMNKYGINPTIDPRVTQPDVNLLMATQKSLKTKLNSIESCLENKTLNQLLPPVKTLRSDVAHFINVNLYLYNLSISSIIKAHYANAAAITEGQREFIHQQRQLLRNKILQMDGETPAIKKTYDEFVSYEMRNEMIQKFGLNTAAADLNESHFVHLSFGMLKYKILPVNMDISELNSSLPACASVASLIHQSLDSCYRECEFQGAKNYQLTLAVVKFFFERFFVSTDQEVISIDILLRNLLFRLATIHEDAFFTRHTAADDAMPVERFGNSCYGYSQVLAPNIIEEDKIGAFRRNDDVIKYCCLLENTNYGINQNLVRIPYLVNPFLGHVENSELIKGNVIRLSAQVLAVSRIFKKLYDDILTKQGITSINTLKQYGNLEKFVDEELYTQTRNSPQGLVANFDSNIAHIYNNTNVDFREVSLSKLSLCNLQRDTLEDSLKSSSLSITMSNTVDIDAHDIAFNFNEDHFNSLLVNKNLGKFIDDVIFKGDCFNFGIHRGFLTQALQCQTSFFYDILGIVDALKYSQKNKKLYKFQVKNSCHNEIGNKLYQLLKSDPDGWKYLDIMQNQNSYNSILITNKLIADLFKETPFSAKLRDLLFNYQKLTSTFSNFEDHLYKNNGKSDDLRMLWNRDQLTQYTGRIQISDKYAQDGVGIGVSMFNANPIDSQNPPNFEDRPNDLDILNRSNIVNFCSTDFYAICVNDSNIKEFLIDVQLSNITTEHVPVLINDVVNLTGIEIRQNLVNNLRKVFYQNSFLEQFSKYDLSDFENRGYSNLEYFMGESRSIIENKVADVYIDLLFCRLTKRFLHALIDYNIPFPFGFLIFRPYVVTHVCNIVIGAFETGEIGFFAVNPLDVMFGDDPYIKSHYLHITGYSAPVITNPAGLFYLDNFCMTGFHFGHNTKFMTPEDMFAHRKQNYRLPDVRDSMDYSKHPSMICVLTSYDPEIDSTLDIRGRFPDDDLSVPRHFPTTASYYDLTGFGENENNDMPNKINYRQPDVNFQVTQTHQLLYDEGQNKLMIPVLGKCALGPRQYPGMVRNVLSGITNINRAVLKDFNYESLILGGGVQASLN